MARRTNQETNLRMGNYLSSATRFSTATNPDPPSGTEVATRTSPEPESGPTETTQQRPPVRQQIQPEPEETLPARQTVYRKPILYIFSPRSDLNVSVTLSLIPELRFSAIYPVVPVKRSSLAGESIRWNIRTRHDGNLLEVDTAMETSYLFWEAV